MRRRVVHAGWFTTAENAARWLAVLVLWAAPPARGLSRPEPEAPLPVARITYAEGLVELASGRAPFAAVKDGTPLRPGDRLRTGPRGTARIEFPWMAVSVSAGSVLSIPENVVLATFLEEGRVEQASDTGDLLKLLTEEGRVRGEGRVVVRRERGRTSVSVLRGRFQAEAAGATVAVGAGEGAMIAAGAAPSKPAPLPEPPSDLEPGADAVYAYVGEAIPLRWQSGARAHHLEVLAIHTNEVLLARDVGAATAEVAIPWQGTFRWRVAARDAQGLEGPPSAEGLITVVLP